MAKSAHKTQRMASELTFTVLERYHEDSDGFLNHIIRVTDEESCYIETKQQSKQRMHTHSPSKPKKCNQTLSTSQKADHSS
jgi:hypothetical protein